jgi:succinate dehydrogenase / fumarate reductase cytochrome b subunit
MSTVVSKPGRSITPPALTRMFRLWGSSLGQKIIMAVTGVVLSAFVLGHMAGNLQVFQGREAINAYSALLHREPALLWGARVVLLTAVGLHIWAYIALTRINQRARPRAYQKVHYKESSFASRSMRLSGPLLLAFIVFHILHLTTGTVHPDYHAEDVYQNLIRGLSVVWVSAVYLLAMAMLGFHLWHGVWSMTQTLGGNQARYNSPGRKLATVFTLVVVLGFAAVPLAVLARLVR